MARTTNEGERTACAKAIAAHSALLKIEGIAERRLDYEQRTVGTIGLPPAQVASWEMRIVWRPSWDPLERWAILLARRAGLWTTEGMSLLAEMSVSREERISDFLGERTIVDVPRPVSVELATEPDGDWIHYLRACNVPVYTSREFTAAVGDIGTFGLEMEAELGRSASHSVAPNTQVIALHGERGSLVRYRWPHAGVSRISCSIIGSASLRLEAWP